MWINRDEWERMKERVSELETWRGSQEYIGFHAPNEYRSSSSPWPQKPSISLQHAITLIMDYLHLKFHHYEGHPAHNGVVKQETVKVKV